MTKLALLLAALFWAFVKVGGDFRAEPAGNSAGKPLRNVEGDFGEAGW